MDGDHIRAWQPLRQPEQVRNVDQATAVAAHRSMALHVSGNGVWRRNRDRLKILRQRADLMHLLLRAEQQIFVLVILTGQRAHNVARVRAHAELIHPADVDGNLHREILRVRTESGYLAAYVD